MVGFMITNGDTHAPEYWTETIIAQLVPILPGITPETAAKVELARAKLRQPVVETMTAIRLHERTVFGKLSKSDRELLIASEQNRHTGSNAALEMSSLPINKFKAADEWLDTCVKRICKVASECDGDKPPSDQMVDLVYRVMNNWVRTVQIAERSHYVTSGAAF